MQFCGRSSEGAWGLQSSHFRGRFIIKVAHASLSFAHARFPGVSPRVDGDWNLRTFRGQFIVKVAHAGFPGVPGELCLGAV